MLGRRQRFEIFLPAFGAHNPEAPQELQEQNMYPIATYTPDAMDLDYSALLLADGLVIDQCSLDFVSDPRRQHLSLMRESIDRLGEADLLRCADYGKIIDENEDSIRTRVERLLDMPEGWLGVARTHWKLYKPTLGAMIDHYGDAADPRIERLHFGVFCHLAKSGDAPDSSRARQLHRLLESTKRRLSGREADDLKIIIRPIVTHVVMMQLLRKKLGCPFLDWEDLSPYYQRLEEPMWEDLNASESAVTADMVRKVKELFSVALPELRPRSVPEVLKFISKRRAVRSLRREVRDAVLAGTRLDPSWAQRMKNQANRAQIIARKRQRIISWLGVGLGGIPLLGLSDVASTVANLGQDLAGQTISSQTERTSLSRFEWYYLLLTAKSDTD